MIGQWVFMSGNLDDRYRIVIGGDLNQCVMVEGSDYGWGELRFEEELDGWCISQSTK